VQHFMANGYANGWLITPNAQDPPRRLVLSYTPERTATRALALSGAVLLLAAATAALQLASRTRGPRR